ncbi:hypothetical protein OAD66_07110 [Bacteroidia bacterium]|nr:hypothetical protein [Bacteroidia bacterium]
MFQSAVLKYVIVLSASILLMIVGILDDRLNLRAKHGYTFSVFTFPYCNGDIFSN